MLVEDHKLDAVISLPSGAFKPYAGVSTAILLFTKTGVGGTDTVWFYDVQADGWSLDDKRTPLLPEDKLGPAPRTPLASAEPAAEPSAATPLRSAEGATHTSLGQSPRSATPIDPSAEGAIYSLGPDHSKNNLPDIVHRWPLRDTAERNNARTAQSFTVPKSEIAQKGYELSLTRYKEAVHEHVEGASPKEILAELRKLEVEIQQSFVDLEAMLR